MTSSGALTSTVFTGRGYYVDSAAGNDANLGTSTSPWKTLARVARGVYAKGDAILLKCGGVWRESLTINPLMFPAGGATVGAYGDCTATNRPVISGSDAITGTSWSVSSSFGGKPVYVARVPRAVTQLFYNYVPMVLARQPNFGGVGAEFSLTSGAGGNNWFSLSSADRAALGSANLAGAKAYIRTEPWGIETAEVLANDTSTGGISLKTATKYPLNRGEGYYLEGKVAFLDAPNEWFYDAAQGLLYFWTPTGESPAMGVLESMQRGTGLSITQVPDSRVEKITFVRHSGQSLRVFDSPRTVVSDVMVKQGLKYGITVEASGGSNSADTRIERSTIVDVSHVGISISSPRVTVTATSVEGTGMTPLVNDPMAGINVVAPSGSVTNNRILNSARAAIMLNQPNDMTVSGNYISQACKRLTDCGAIYSWGNYNQTARPQIVNNNIRDLIPNIEGAVGGAPSLVAGVYLDEQSLNTDVIGNMVSKASVGVNIHDSGGHNVQGNTIWQTTRASVRLHSSDSTIDRVRGNVIQGNTLFASSHLVASTVPAGMPTRQEVPAQEYMHFLDANSMFTGVNPNVSRNNTIGTMSDKANLKWSFFSGSSLRYLDFSQWSALASGEQVKQTYVARPFLITPVGGDLVQNTSLASPGSPWKLWTSTASIGASLTFGTCTTGCADVVPGSSSDVVYGNTMTLNSTPGDNLYYFAFAAKAVTPSATMGITLSRNYGDWASVGLVIPKMTIDSSRDTVVEQLFNATITDTTRLNVLASKGDTYRIREVHIYKVGSYELFSPAAESAMLANENSTARTATCAEAGLRTCTATDLNGQPISWPVTIPANSSLVVMTADSKWKPAN